MHYEQIYLTHKIQKLVQMYRLENCGISLEILLNYYNDKNTVWINQFYMGICQEILIKGFSNTIEMNKRKLKKIGLEKCMDTLTAISSDCLLLFIFIIMIMSIKISLNKYKVICMHTNYLYAFICIFQFIKLIRIYCI